MKTISKTAFLAFTLTMLSITSCTKKTDPTPAAVPKNSRIVKYEINGNYSGQLNIVYTNASGALESLNISSLPWTKEITFANSVGGAGFGGNTAGYNFGGPSQSVTLKLYSAGNVVQSGSASTDSNGLINLPSLAYVFP